MGGLYESYVTSISTEQLPITDLMVNSYDVIQALLSAVTLLVAAMVAYRAFRGYRVARNLNLLLLALGFGLLSVYFLLTTLGDLGQAVRTYPPDRLLGRYFLIAFIQIVAYFLVMLAYVIKPRSEEVVLPVLAVALVAVTFELFILLLLLVVMISVWAVYRSTPTASTALVLASFTLLFALHATTALLLFSPRLLAAGSVYYAVMQMLSFALLFMAIGRHSKRDSQRGTAESA